MSKKLSKIMNTVVENLAAEAIRFSVNEETGEIFAYVPVSMLSCPPVMLRDIKEKREAEMIDSIRLKGQESPLLIKPEFVEKTENGTKKTVLQFSIMDGLQRYNAMQKISAEYVAKCIISERYTLWDSIHTNIKRIQQDKTELAKTVLYLVEKENLSFSQIARELGYTEQAVESLFRLNALPEEVKACIKQGTINVGQADILAKAVRAETSPERFNLLVEKAKQGVPASELASMRKTWQSQDAAEKRSKKGEEKTIPAFDYRGQLSPERASMFKSKVESIVDQASLDGRELTETEQALLDAMQFIFCLTPEDIRKEREKYEELYKIK
jgi:hypothetical protein